MDYYPRPPKGGPPLLPYARRAPRSLPSSVPLVVPQRSRPPGGGSGTRGALCMEHGVPSCSRCKSLGWGISCCCRAGHEGQCGPSAGLACPPGATQDRAWPPGPRPIGATCGGGSAIRLAGQGTPCVPGAPGNGAPGEAPERAHSSTHPPRVPPASQGSPPSLAPRSARRRRCIRHWVRWLPHVYGHNAGGCAEHG